MRTTNNLEVEADLLNNTSKYSRQLSVNQYQKWRHELFPEETIQKMKIPKIVKMSH